MRPKSHKEAVPPTLPGYGQAGVFGVLWGLPVAASQFQVNLTAGTLADGLASFFLLIVPLWCATGLLLAWANLWLAARLPALVSAALALLAATAGHEVIVLANSAQMGLVLGHPPQAQSTFFFALWNILGFGGLLLAALAKARREARTAEVVANSEIARNRDVAALNAVDLKDLRGQLSPSMLVWAVSELGRRYAADSASGERLLDRLVAFLRATMPGVRTGRSTLPAEMETVRTYAALLADLDSTRGKWRVRMRVTPPDIYFPPLLLAPTLEALAEGDPTAALMIILRRTHGLLVLEASGPAHLDCSATDELVRRLRRRLRQAFGESATVSIGEPSGRAALMISLPASSTSGQMPRPIAAMAMATAIPTLKGESHAP